MHHQDTNLAQYFCGQTQLKVFNSFKNLLPPNMNSFFIFNQTTSYFPSTSSKLDNNEEKYMKRYTNNKTG